MASNKGNHKINSVKNQENQQPSQGNSQQSNQQSQQQPDQQDANQQAETEQNTKKYFELPKILSIKDIGHLHGLLSMNLHAVKQYQQAAQNCQLPDIKCQIEEAGKMHLKHYDDLLTFIAENGGNSQ